MKIISMIIPEKSSNILCDCMIEIIPGLIVTGVSLYDGKYGRFIKGPSIKLENGKHKELIKFEGELKENIFNFINDIFSRVEAGEDVDFKILKY